MDLAAAACDPCRKVKKGCDRKEPCGRCRTRGKEEQCTREIARQRLAEEASKQKENEMVDDDARIDIDAEIAAQLAAEELDTPDAAARDDDQDSIGENSGQYDDREIPEIDNPHAALHAMYDVASTSSLSSVKSLSSSSDSDDDDDDDNNANTTAAGEEHDGNAADAPPAGVMTRKQQEAYDRKKAEKLQAEEYARQPKFIFTIPLALQRWDHKKCDRCRDKNKECIRREGEESCDRCVAENMTGRGGGRRSKGRNGRQVETCSTKEGKKKFMELEEEARVKQFDRFEDNKEVAEMRAVARRKALAKNKLALEIKLSQKQDEFRKTKGEKLKVKRQLNKALKKVKEFRRERGEESEEEEEDEDGDEDDEEMLQWAVKMSLESGEDEEEGDVEMKEADEEP